MARGKKRMFSDFLQFFVFGGAFGGSQLIEMKGEIIQFSSRVSDQTVT